MAIDQKKANPELAAWLEARQSALKIVKTTKTPSGQTLDWIPYESQDPVGRAAVPPPVHSMPVRAEDKLRLVTAAGFELDDPSIERGPAGTVPVVRPDFSQLTRTISLKDYGSKRGGLLVNKNRPNKNPADPDPFGYFHAMSSQSAKIYGCDGFLSVWDPSINNAPGPGDDQSILQTWPQNYDKGVQSIEAGWTVDRNLNGDTIAHLFTFYTTNAYSQEGNNLGGYNRQYSGWVQYSPTVFPGIRINGASVQGGQQLDISIKYQLYQNRWWFGAQGIWMGYYPASLFNGGLG